jgi:hypothetical protein
VPSVPYTLLTRTEAHRYQVDSDSDGALFGPEDQYQAATTLLDSGPARQGLRAGQLVYSFEQDAGKLTADFAVCPGRAARQCCQAGLPGRAARPGLCRSMTVYPSHRANDGLSESLARPGRAGGPLDGSPRGGGGPANPPARADRLAGSRSPSRPHHLPPPFRPGRVGPGKRQE